MVDRNHARECINCGKAELWNATVVQGRKTRALPEGWSMELHTVAGAAHFCSANCMDVWKNTRPDGWYREPEEYLVR